MGAGLGSAISAILPTIDTRLIALLSMVGYFAAVVQSPLTAFVIVMEMTDNQAMLIPLMATALLSAGLSRLINREPLYHALSHRIVSGPVRHRRRHTPRPTAPSSPVPD